MVVIVPPGSCLEETLGWVNWSGAIRTPQITGPIELVRPNVMYVFADPKLEALPAGQKLLIRMGADNATVVKAKLMELRAIITAAGLKH